MNNVECYDDFAKTLTVTYSGIRLDQRDEMLVRMAINHAYLCAKEESSKQRCKCGHTLDTPNEQFVNQCAECERKERSQRKYSALGFYPKEATDHD